jgi:hypothetical protein
MLCNCGVAPLMVTLEISASCPVTAAALSPQQQPLLQMHLDADVALRRPKLRLKHDAGRIAAASNMRDDGDAIHTTRSPGAPLSRLPLAQLSVWVPPLHDTGW